MDFWNKKWGHLLTSFWPHRFSDFPDRSTYRFSDFPDRSTGAVDRIGRPDRSWPKKFLGHDFWFTIFASVRNLRFLGHDFCVRNLRMIQNRFPKKFWVDSRFLRTQYTVDRIGPDLDLDRCFPHRSILGRFLIDFWSRFLCPKIWDPKSIFLGRVGFLGTIFGVNFFSENQKPTKTWDQNRGTTPINRYWIFFHYWIFWGNWDD